jgi:hypothetical protein
MARSSPFAMTVLATVAMIGAAQSVAQARSLNSIVQELGSSPDQLGPQWVADLDTTVNAASIAEIKQALPTLLAFTESPDPQLRIKALLVVYGIASRKKADPPGNRGEPDLQADELIVPYLPRLAPRLTDPATPARSMALLLFQALVVMHPAPQQLLTIELDVLHDPQSTQQTPDTTQKSVDRKAPSIGPQILCVLLPIGATYFVDPATGITEGRASPEVRQAIIDFLHRPDQTAESTSESIRALAMAQPQNPDVNAELLPFLDSPDTTVQSAMLGNLPRLTLTPQDFASAKARVTQLANDPAKQAEVRKLANAILPCWTNDRHKGICPALGS